MSERPSYGLLGLLAAPLSRAIRRALIELGNALLQTASAHGAPEAPAPAGADVSSLETTPAAGSLRLPAAFSLGTCSAGVGEPRSNEHACITCKYLSSRSPAPGFSVPICKSCCAPINNDPAFVGCAQWKPKDQPLPAPSPPVPPADA